jgi:hypothetical protein
VKTGSFRTYTGPGRISIARWAPRHTPAGYRVYSRLAPGPWFNSVSIEEYCHLYGEILKKLDPKRVYAELVALVAPEEPVLLCWEVPPFAAPRPIPQAGLTMIGRSNWCHRRLVAAWFKQTLGIDVPELELPSRQPACNYRHPLQRAGQVTSSRDRVWSQTFRSCLSPRSQAANSVVIPSKGACCNMSLHPHFAPLSSFDHWR